MRKILGIAIFMLTLLPVLNIGDAFSLYAQNFSYENGSYWIPEVEVNGKHKVKCDCCKESFDDEEAFDRHLEHNYNCRNYYGIKDDNDDDDDDKDNDNNNGGDLGFGGKDFCPYCNKPYGSCSCRGADVTGKNKGSSIWWGIDIAIPPTDPPSDDEECNASDNTTTSTSTHRCSCLVTSTRKTAVRNISSGTISPKNKKTGFSASEIAKSLKKTIEFPETIKQGIYGTCGAAMMEKELATYHPYMFRECIESLINTGQYDKWGLTLPDASGIKSMTDSEAAKKGLSTTDIIFQTAFATWAGNNHSFNKMKNAIFGKSYIFKPKTAREKDGGTSENDIKKFLHKILKIPESDAKPTPGDNFSKLSNIDCSSYTYLVGVHSKYNKNTGKFEFPNEKPNHFAEITSIDKDGVHVWTWGKEITMKNLYVSSYIKRAKTPDVKKDENEGKSLVCKCSNCKDTGCSQCK